MIRLLQFPPTFNVPNPSPFCIKAEVLLKMARVPYESVIVPDPRKGPKGKLPAIEDDGQVIGDSELIRWHLERKYKIDFDRGLSEADRATAHAFTRLLEERTYWVMVYNRWIPNWPTVRSAFFGSLPPVVRSIVPPIAQRKVRGYLSAQGLGRHSEAEIYEMGVRDVRAVATQLGDKPFFMGNDATGVDATVFATVVSILDPPFESPVKEEARKHANLVGYSKRLRAQYFP
jgi:glutathione S-transferase